MSTVKKCDKCGKLIEKDDLDGEMAKSIHVSFQHGGGGMPDCLKKLKDDTTWNAKLDYHEKCFLEVWREIVENAHDLEITV